MIRLETLRDSADRHTLHVHCHGCGHGAAIPWLRLADRHGWDTPVSSLPRRLVCRKCGGRDCGITIAFNAVGGYQYGDNRASG